MGRTIPTDRFNIGDHVCQCDKCECRRLAKKGARCTMCKAGKHTKY